MTSTCKARIGKSEILGIGRARVSGIMKIRLLIGTPSRGPLIRIPYQYKNLIEFNKYAYTTQLKYVCIGNQHCYHNLRFCVRPDSAAFHSLSFDTMQYYTYIGRMQVNQWSWMSSEMSIEAVAEK